jgi:iron complex outermembrane receptor protein
MSNFRVNKLALALALSSSSALALAQYQDANSLQVDVTGSREGGQSILTPTKILAGDELQNKLGATLGATLANELGVSATGYGSGASRPVIRGLGGPRVQIAKRYFGW